MKYSLEMIHRVYNDEDGSYVEIAPHGDLPGLIGIRYVDAAGKKQQNDLDFDRASASFLRDVLIKICNDDSVWEAKQREA